MAGSILDNFSQQRVRMLERVARRNGVNVDTVIIRADGRHGVYDTGLQVDGLPKRPDAATERFIYFIRARRTKLIKVGVADDVLKRLRALQGSSPDKLVLLGIVSGSQNQEAMFHSVLSAHRLHGEWFRPGPWVKVVLDVLQEKPTAQELLKRLEALVE